MSRRRKQIVLTSDQTAWQLYRRLLGYVRPHRMMFLASFIGFMIFSATNVATAQWLGWTVDQVQQANMAARYLSPILCVGIVIIRGIGGFLGEYSLQFIANSIVHTLRCQMIEKLLVLPISYFDHNVAGRVVSKVTYDSTQITGAATNAVTVMLREGLTVIGLMSALFWMNWQLSLVFLMVTPCVALVVRLASFRFRRYSRQMQNSMGDVTQISNESIKGQKVVRTFNAVAYVKDRFLRSSERNRRQNMKMVTTQAIATPFVQLLVSIALAVLIWFAMSPAILADSTAGEFVTFLTMAGLLAKPIRQLSQVNSVIQRGISAADSIFTLLDEAVEQDTGTVVKEKVEGRLEFRQVGFAYKPGVPVLEDISFSVEPGQTIALVGKSGSGKSTLVSLLPRFYELSSGQITLDGVALADYKLGNLRQHISLVNQDVILFDGTVAENIAYGMLDKVSEEQILEAARHANALEFISQMEGGIHAMIGDGGSRLSGGQRQRLAIARAFLKNAPILILDEATSALDTESEHHIQQALQSLIKGRTTFVVAHRLSTIENADRILVMSQGRIVESGQHAELLARNGHYARLHKKQFVDEHEGKPL
ncbi:MAG: lipid A export permease/ATP-binding protein MsbA [Pseudomonadales bacterium]|nr:lipid A export permease/ATP-binding protein MsbA [Pseudomonadales bacterium]